MQRKEKMEDDVKYSTRKWIALVITLAGVMAMGACKKKTVAPPPPPPPPPAAPSATLSANPNTIQQGQSSTLSWRTDNATQVSIEGIGSVEPNGSQSVTPKDSTTYRLLAKGPGGAQEATARVTVTPPPAARPQPSGTEEQLFAQNVHDIFFDYDRFDIRPDQSATLQANAQFLQQHPNLRFTIEGYCDERGSTEYNLALGDSRAAAVKQTLVQAGISTDRILTRSYGKEKPFCAESNELCWQQNRRGHFVYHK